MRGQRTVGAVGALCGLGVAIVVLVAGAPARAQIVFDGNVVFNNNATGTFAGQFTGAASAGPTCAVGLTAAGLATGTYTHNVYGDPLLPNAPYQQNVAPNFKPAPGSPAWTNNAVLLPSDGFFQQTCYAGAIGPLAGDDWTVGWTYYDSTGANRQDLHLVGVPNPRPLAIYQNVNLYSSQTWKPDSNYEIRGQLRVKDQTTLTIQPGVVIFGQRSSVGTLIVERGGKIMAVGTAAAPIIMTTSDPPGTMSRGGWGGLVINGYARTNQANTCADSVASEGGAIGYYGGNDDDDDSGQLRYVRIEYAGKQITVDNELNSFTFNSVGRQTQVEYCEAFRGSDDAFETFGGTVNMKHMIGIDGTDDGYDWQLGFRGKAQFIIIRVSPEQAPESVPPNIQFGDKGIEADNNEFGHDRTNCTGSYSNPTVANCTFVGDKRSGAPFPGVTSAVNLRRGTAGQIFNSICYNFKTAAVKLDDNSTWEHHCAAAGAGVAPIPAPVPGAPGACNIVGVPLGEGQVFVSGGAPNPFRNQVALTFTLPHAGAVSVKVFSASGRLITTLQRGEMSAGPQAVVWRVGPGVAPGVYYYRIEGDGQQSAGKIIRID